MGVCSVRYGNSIVALCPRRFLQDNIVFKNIADHYFKTRNDLVVFSEIGLPHTGTFDYVMVKHKPFSSDIEDFIVIEFQTGQTTGTGQITYHAHRTWFDEDPSKGSKASQLLQITIQYSGRSYQAKKL
jgi:Restriction endonuclease NotI